MPTVPRDARGAPFARRSLLGFGLAALARAARTGPDQTLIVWNSDSGSYAEAVEGIREGFGDAAGRELSLVDLKSDPGLALLDAASGAAPRNAIAVGLEAQRALAPHAARFPVFTTMVHKADGIANAMTLDVPLAVLLDELSTLMPGKKRFGILESAAAGPQAVPAAVEKAAQLGFSLSTSVASQADAVGPAFLALRRKVDAVIVAPDRNVYDTASLGALLRMSLESGLPLVLFAPGLVKAGGAIGIYPDYFEVGLQTAEAVRTAKAAEAPRKLTVALNMRTLRLGGLKVKDTRANGESCLVFR